jgi:hypothetical protein
LQSQFQVLFGKGIGFAGTGRRSIYFERILQDKRGIMAKITNL